MGGEGRVALTREREDTGLGEPAELLEDAAALGDADGEGHLLPARARRGHRRRARAPQLGVVRARLGHLLPTPAADLRETETGVTLWGTNERLVVGPS
jgi:hypothetical protein